MSPCPYPRCAATLLLLATLLTGCFADPVEPRFTLWEATLSATALAPTLTGSAGALAEPDRRRTEVSIRISGGPPAEVLSWRVRAGTCSERGTVVGAAASYAELRTDDSGGATTESRLSQALADRGTYHVEVLASDGTGILACGALHQLQATVQ